MKSSGLSQTRELLAWIAKCPTAFQAVDTICAELASAGFVRLCEHEAHTLHAGGRYYVTRNGSSVVAFRIPAAGADRFMLMVSHTDSPMFKLKPDFCTDAFGKYVRLNTERYGGMILSSWLDRPLSVAGRAIVREKDRLIARSVVIDRDLALIPNVCIHFSRDINDGFRYNPAIDLLPLFSAAGNANCLTELIAQAAGTVPDQLAAMDLYLYNRMPGTIWGGQCEFFSAPRIDNLMCAFGTLRGFLSAEDSPAIQVYASLDNEEVGSQSRQGAGSLFMRDTLDAIAQSVGCNLPQMLARSFLVSADNAHARHPNHPELSDSGQNAPNLNEGVVIKHNAQQRYTSDAVSSALFEQLCQDADVPVQHFANRSDLAGGSTLGAILNSSLPLCSVDIGMAQLAMHASYETAGCCDTKCLIEASKAFYSHALDVYGTNDFALIK